MHRRVFLSLCPRSCITSKSLCYGCGIKTRVKHPLLAVVCCKTCRQECPYLACMGKVRRSLVSLTHSLTRCHSFIHISLLSEVRGEEHFQAVRRRPFATSIGHERRRTPHEDPFPPRGGASAGSGPFHFAVL